MIKLEYKNADETLEKIKEVLDGIEKIKQNLSELNEMGCQLELSSPGDEESKGLELNK